MKHLTIIRHAKSSWANPDLDDIVRPLNERGLQSIKAMGNYLQLKSIQPDLVITSPASRAMQTAIGMGEYLQYTTDDLWIKQEIYFGNPSSIATMIEKIDDIYEDVFLFGHEPVLSLLIEMLTTTKLQKFPTCAVFRMSFKITQWKHIVSKKGKCDFFIKPKELINK